MARGLQWMAMAIVGLAVGAVGLFALSRWLGPTNAQEQALALMEQSAPLPGRNAFPAFWLMKYDLSGTERAAVMQEDLRRFDAWVRERSPLSSNSSASGHYPEYTEVIDGLPEPCRLEDKDCLERVRADPEGYARWRELQAGLLENAALEGYGHYRSQFPLRLQAPFLPFSLGVRARLGSHALDFVQGKLQEAFAGVCTDIDTWRRLGATADDSIMRTTSMRVVDSASHLFAQMLAEAPPTQVLPAACEVAFQPPAIADTSLCEMMKGELKTAKELDAPRSLVFDPHMHHARIAHGYSGACAKEMELAILEDRPLPKFGPSPRYGVDCLANAASCILADIAWPAYVPYMVRGQDHGARMRLASTVYWLHVNRDDPRPLADRLAARPAALRGMQREIEIMPGGVALRIAQNASGRDAYWELPLAPSSTQEMSPAGPGAPAAGATMPGSAD